MTPREPDRFEEKANEICAERGIENAKTRRILADALRAVEAETRQACIDACDDAIGALQGDREVEAALECIKRIRALASPAAAPAVEPTQEQLRADLERAAPGADELAASLRKQFRADPATEYDQHVVARSACPPPSEPAAPSLLPRVLAALEDAAKVTIGPFWESLAVELRAYIAEREPAEKRVAELERKAEAWADAIEYCEYSFSPEWLADVRHRSIFAAHIFRLLDAARAATAKGEGT